MSEKSVLTRRDVLKGAGVAAVAAAGIAKAGTAEAAKAPRMAFVIDIDKCTGCRTCTIACKSEFNVPLGRWNAVIKVVDSGTHPNNRRDFVPRLCNHCAGDKEKKVPPCVEKCPEAKSGKRAKLGKVRYRTGATYKRPDGMILFDNKLCIGCYKCLKACPYGARWIDPHTKLDKPNRENDLGIGKCSACQHRVDNGVVPSCVQACPAFARTFGDLNDSGSDVAKLVKKHNLMKNVLLPDEKTNPHVFYVDTKGVLAKYKFDHKDEKARLAEFRDKII